MKEDTQNSDSQTAGAPNDESDIDLGVNADQMQDYQDMLDNTPLIEIIRGMSETLSIIAVRNIGNEDLARRDLVDAGLAIDSMDALFKIIDPKLKRDVREEMRSTLSYLQLAFANEVKRQSGAPLAEEDGPEA